MSCNKAKISNSSGKMSSGKVRSSARATGSSTYGQPKVRISFGNKSRNR